MKSFLLLISAAAVSACVSVLPEKETPKGLYRFGPMDQAHRLDASVLVREPEASRLYSGRAIASEDADGALRLVRGVAWTDSATRMMQYALIDTLGGPGGRVAIATETGATADFELAWRISDFTLKGTEARCRLEATLLQGRTRKILAQTTIATGAVALKDSNAARAKALTDAGRACVSEVGAFVADHTQASARLAE
jgi:cholesterol transport system auxiliary component